jgi:hypothetical protein
LFEARSSSEFLNYRWADGDPSWKMLGVGFWTLSIANLYLSAQVTSTLPQNSFVNGADLRSMKTIFGWPPLHSHWKQRS